MAWLRGKRTYICMGLAVGNGALNLAGIIDDEQRNKLLAVLVPGGLIALRSAIGRFNGGGRT